MDKYLVIGEITKPQGVRGEVKLRPITCDPGRFDALTLAYLRRGEDYLPVRLTVNRRAQDAVYLSVEGVDDRDAAEKLRGELLYIDRAHAVELDEEEKLLVDALLEQELSFDELSALSKFPASKLNSLLTSLELRGIIVKAPGGIYRAYQ